MPEDVAVAAPFAAGTTNEPIEIPRSGTPEYAEWRNSGKLPAKTSEAKPVEPPATDTPKAETAVEPEPAAGPKQESRRKPDAEARIKELTDLTAQLKKDLEDARKPKEAKADPPPARQPDAKPKVDDQVDGKPKYATYEDYVEALADYKAEQRILRMQQEQTQAKQLESTTQKLNEARSRYQDYDSKAIPVVQELLKDGVSKEVFSVLNDSPVLADVLYTIGGSEETKADFLEAARTNPGKALRVALLIEQEVIRELSKGKESSARDDKGKFTAKEETPVKRGPDSIPPPPLEIGSRGGIPKETDAVETGDFRAFAAARNAQDLKRLQRGA
jgi:hypothetical protein